MALELADIIAAARDRTGNKADVSVGEQFVPDEAITTGLKEAVIECNAVFGESTARKECSFQAVAGGQLPAPGAPTLASDTTAGILPAGTYNYQITATRDSGETLPSVPATVSVTLSGTGEVTVSWTAVAGADGYNIYGRAPGSAGLLVNVPATVLSWVDQGYAQVGRPVPSLDTTGTAGPYLQDYDIPTYVGTDVQEILEVLRSDSYFDDSMLQPMQVDPRTGIPYARAAFIDMAYQQDVLRVMQGIARYNKDEDQSWEIISVNNREVLRLMPPPTQPVLIVVRYLSTGEAVETLPEEARPALEYAACVALLDAVLNRVNSAPAGMGETARDRRYWLELVERQRDRYESKFREALGKRPKE